MLPFDHDCPNNPAETVSNREEETSLISSIISEAKKRFQNATGGSKRRRRRRPAPVGDQSIRPENRITLEVVFPLDEGEKKVDPVLMFFDKRRRVGQVLDQIAKHGGIRNTNNSTSTKVD